MTVLGIDISRWQLSTPSLDGLGFCFVKAVEGATIDPLYNHHAKSVRAAGIILGAYAFGVDSMGGAAQAAKLLQYAPTADLYALDVEGQHAPHEQAVRDFGKAMHAAGKAWGLYGSASGYPSWGQDWRWVAQWGPTPPDCKWDFWQRRGSPLDLDTFRGTVADLHRLARVKPPQLYRVRITATTPIYDHPDGRITGHVSQATYTCTRVMSGGLWWYHIKAGGKVRGYFKPTHDMTITEL